MKGEEFIRRVQAVGRARVVPVVFDKRHGKGSHGTLYYGAAKRTVKDRRKEIGPGMLNAMLRQLGLIRRDFE